MSSSMETSKPPITGTPPPSPRTDLAAARAWPRARPTLAFPRLLLDLDARAGAGGKALATPLASATEPALAAALTAPEAAGPREARKGHEAGPEDAVVEARDGAPFDPLDPAARQAAQLAPPAASAPSPWPLAVAADAEIAPRARVSMEELLPQLVKRVAWAGDRRRGSVQLELGAGRHAGTTVTVHADAGRVRVELDGVGADALRERIRTRLARQGLDVESVT